jgi:hypothetical protein
MGSRRKSIRLIYFNMMHQSHNDAVTQLNYCCSQLLVTKCVVACDRVRSLQLKGFTAYATARPAGISRVYAIDGNRQEVVLSPLSYTGARPDPSHTSGPEPCHAGPSKHSLRMGACVPGPTRARRLRSPDWVAAAQRRDAAARAMPLVTSPDGRRTTGVSRAGRSGRTNIAKHLCVSCQLSRFAINGPDQPGVSWCVLTATAAQRAGAARPPAVRHSGARRPIRRDPFADEDARPAAHGRSHRPRIIDGAGVLLDHWFLVGSRGACRTRTSTCSNGGSDQIRARSGRASITEDVARPI